MLLRFFGRLTALYLRLCGAERARLEAGQVSLVYYRVGPEGGEPWVLLHGLGAVAAIWGPVLRALRRDCRVLAPELSALGGSEVPGGGLTVEAAVEIVAQLIERERGGRPVTLAGISLGGWMAVRLALARPDLVSRLVLVDAGGWRDQDWERIEELVTVEDLAGVDRLYPAMFARVPWIMRLSRPGFLAAYTSPAVKSVLAGLAEGDTFDADDLARLNIPVGLIWGEHDGLFSVETGRAMAAALPQAHLEVLADCGHAVHMERPRQLVRAIQGFRRRFRYNPPHPTHGGDHGKP